MSNKIKIKRGTGAIPILEVGEPGFSLDTKKLYIGTTTGNELINGDIPTIPTPINNTTSTSTTLPLAANQGKVLKGYIDSINTLLLSDETNLDTLQEIVDFIQLNKATLDTLGISNIAGLQTALDSKALATQVLTNVPAGAKFTDTIYSLTKAKIEAVLTGNITTHTHPQEHDIILIPDTAVTITQTHFNKTLIITSSSNVTITVPTKIVESIEKGFFCDIIRYGTGEVSFSGVGIVLNSAGPLSIDAQYIAASLIKIDDNNEWLLIGGRE